jgi:hypothetical protein
MDMRESLQLWFLATLAGLLMPATAAAQQGSLGLVARAEPSNIAANQSAVVHTLVSLPLPGGGPAVGAAVTVDSDGGRMSSSGYTDSNGRFTTRWSCSPSCAVGYLIGVSAEMAGYGAARNFPLWIEIGGGASAPQPDTPSPGPGAGGWGACEWKKVGAQESHQPGPAWCLPGSFLTQFDLDGGSNLNPHDAPIVGQARCCRAQGFQLSQWGPCAWVDVGGQRSHQPGPDWCPLGSFLTQFDLDGGSNLRAHDAPIVGRANCCQLLGGPPVARKFVCEWVRVGAERSHQPGPDWCPEGSFLTQFDLDGESNLSPTDAPIVGQAKCCRP